MEEDQTQMENLVLQRGGYISELESSLTTHVVCIQNSDNDKIFSL